MIDLIIYKDFEIQNIIRSYISLIWVRRFNDVGEFTLTLSLNSENVEIIKSGNIIVNTSTGEGAFLENISSKTSIDGELHFEISGRFLSSILDRRLVTFIGSKGLKTLMVDTLVSNFINDTNNPKRNIEELRVINTDLLEDLPINVEYDNKNALEVIKELTTSCNVGFKVGFNIKNKSFDFSIYDGIESMAVFSEEFKNVLEQDYYYKTKDFRNTVYIKNNTSTSIFGDENEGLKRREVFVNSTTQNNLTFEQQVKNILNKYNVIESFDTVINNRSEQFIYKLDYDLGDVVQNESNLWGINVNKKIVEITEYYQDGVCNIAVVFGDVLKRLVV